MPSWGSVVVVIVLLLAVALAREYWRGRLIRRWCDARHARIASPPAPSDVTLLTELAGRFQPRNVSRWGVVLRAEVDGIECILAEHGEDSTRRATRWHTLGIARTPWVPLEAVRLYPAASNASEAVGQITAALMEPGRRTAQHLGIEITPRTGAYRTRHGRWVIDTNEEKARDYWTSEPRAALLQKWHYDGELVAAGEWVAWRVPGRCSTGRRQRKKGELPTTRPAARWTA